MDRQQAISIGPRIIPVAHIQVALFFPDQPRMVLIVTATEPAPLGNGQLTPYAGSVHLELVGDEAVATYVTLQEVFFVVRAEERLAHRRRTCAHQLAQGVREVKGIDGRFTQEPFLRCMLCYYEPPQPAPTLSAGGVLVPGGAEAREPITLAPRAASRRGALEGPGA